jgi:two-component system OmpR family response regulator
MDASTELPPRPRLVVVDDDIQLRGQTAAYLANHGFVVREAGDAASTYKLLETDAIDLLVLDVMLPGQNGLSICRRVAGRRGPAVVILSAMGEDVDRVVGLELGADDYLGKPCIPGSSWRESGPCCVAARRRRPRPTAGRSATPSRASVSICPAASSSRPRA